MRDLWIAIDKEGYPYRTYTDAYRWELLWIPKSLHRGDESWMWYVFISIHKEGFSKYTNKTNTYRLPLTIHKISHTVDKSSELDICERSLKTWIHIKPQAHTYRWRCLGVTKSYLKMQVRTYAGEKKNKCDFYESA